MYVRTEQTAAPRNVDDSGLTMEWVCLSPMEAIGRRERITLQPIVRVALSCGITQVGNSSTDHE